CARGMVVSATASSTYALDSW
nr:immunoglobulin heavy chain junction region [Macaca mulatta]MOV59725.1 immunoglobulin heavy chain junction region [Macaca mulatta]